MMNGVRVKNIQQPINVLSQASNSRGLEVLLSRSVEGPQRDREIPLT